MDSQKTYLEICTASVEDVLTAESAGANRVELNTALGLGGLTPTCGMVELALQQTKLPVIAMARPRESGFCYSASEFETLLKDVAWLAQSGVTGIAFGVLTEQGKIDRARCLAVIREMAPTQEIVFHRAFDLVPNMQEALETLVDCGVHRLMTSGGQATAWQGRQVIASLVEQSRGRIQILAAGGIREDHVTQLVAATGVAQIHAGLGQGREDASYAGGGNVDFYASKPEKPEYFRQSSPDLIRQMVQTLNSNK